MKNKIFTEYFNVDKATVSKTVVNKAIEEQYSKWEKNWKKLNEREYRIDLVGTILSYEIEETENGYKVIGTQETTIQTAVVFIASVLLIPLSLLCFICPIAVVFVVLINTKHLENSVRKAKDAFSSLSAPTISKMTTSTSSLDALERLNTLREKGALTEEEFQIEKKKIL